MTYAHSVTYYFVTYKKHIIHGGSQATNEAQDIQRGPAAAGNCTSTVLVGAGHAVCFLGCISCRKPRKPENITAAVRRVLGCQMSSM
jgi:hypothetical protein